MRTGLAVSVDGVGKQYRLGQLTGGYRLLTEVIAERIGRGISRPPRRPEFWALKDVGFEVERGQTFGIVGHNGAGKSTLLKILSRITPPTTGEVRVRGRVGALLEVGTGFHPELTGRENIALNGAILGMSRVEIAARFDEIVEFAEVQQFIDTPVKRYSSGMYLRLAFAVAAHLEPEVLIVDEVLSVGDAAFQAKCLGRMERVAGEGRTVLFVSHNLTAVQRLCSRSLLLSGGHVVTQGPTDAVVGRYLAGLSSGETEMPLHDRTDREGTGRIRFTSIAYESEGERTDTPVTGRDVTIVLNYEALDTRPLREPVFAIGVYTLLGNLILQLQSNLAGSRFHELPAQGQVRVKLPRLALPAGRYTLNLFAYVGSEVADWLQRATELTVAEGDFYGSGVRPPEGHQSVLVDQEWAHRA